MKLSVNAMDFFVCYLMDNSYKVDVCGCLYLSIGADCVSNHDEFSLDDVCFYETISQCCFFFFVYVILWMLCYKVLRCNMFHVFSHSKSLRSLLMVE